MSGHEKIEIARELLERNLRDLIASIKIDYNIPRLTVILTDGAQIIIRYNNHEEYAYFIIYSESELDRCLFDNYDRLWEVATRPHHFHQRYEKLAIESPMNGDLAVDIIALVEFIRYSKFLPDIH